MEVFQDYAYYYNAFYKDKDYKSEAGQVDMLLKKYGNGIRKIINFGCGTGRHDIELSRIGYQCNGIDMSPVMVELAHKNARKEGAEIAFSVSDIRHPKLIRSEYDAVISLFHVMSYQNTNEDILAVFQSARNALNASGLFLFDAWYGPGVLSDRPQVRMKEVQDDKYRLIRIATPVMHDKTNVVDVYYKVLVIDQKTRETKTINEVHSMRYFFRPELEFYLKETGFELIDNLNCISLGETDYSSWTSYFIAKAV